MNRRRTPPAARFARLRSVSGPALRLLAGMALAAAIVLVLLATTRFEPDALVPVESIEIAGEPRYADVERVRELARRHAPGFITADLAALERSLVAEPWIDGVQLRRQWPGTLVVEVREPVPVARWGEDQLVDRHGRVFGPVDQAEWDYLPALEGQDGRQVVLMRRYLEVSARLADAGLEVAGVAEGRRHDWTIRLESGGRILMGRDAEAARLNALVRAADVVRERRDAPVERWDLRYPHGMAVAWADEDGDAAGDPGTQ
ncbi:MULTISPECIES: cell division protein FtsQ/DivIB [unclassified Thioalkalivibrio]|uniref:cell division protein FtsQ/DivIB n=1 Tax=unclassified Thioalkalivibrio TaxID=2621013 RepID=UPI00036B90AC